jgi:hypothetical protein
MSAGATPLGSAMAVRERVPRLFGLRDELNNSVKLKFF